MQPACLAGLLLCSDLKASQEWPFTAGLAYAGPHGVARFWWAGIQRSLGRGSVWALVGGRAGDLQDHRDRAGGDGVLTPHAG